MSSNFFKVFSKLKVEKEDTIYKFGFDSKGKTAKNCFEYLKDFILNFPLFNLKHQPNINLKLNKVELQKKVSKLTSISELTEKKILEKELVAKNKFDENNHVGQKQNKKVNIDYYDYIIQNDKLKEPFIEEIKNIIYLMNSILYTPPYNILFGRINIEKTKPVDEIDTNLENINDLFYEGFDIHEIKNFYS